MVTEDKLAEIISSKLSVDIVNPVEMEIDPQIIKLFSPEPLIKYLFFPLSVDPKFVEIAMVDPTNYNAVETISAMMKRKVKAHVVKESDFIESLKKYYDLPDDDYHAMINLYGFKPIPGMSDGDDHLGESVDFNTLISMASDEFETVDEEEPEDETYKSGDAAIIKLANGILLQAIKKGASDIHLEPFETSFQVRFRMDGSLSKIMTLPVSIKAAIVSRFKIMANLNIAEKRKPQDGRIRQKLGGNRTVDFRVSILPTLFGEAIVIRILDKGKLQLDISKVGMSETVQTEFQNMCDLPQGLVLVTGPTGSGKTHTLYSAISKINKPEIKILTAEDPVEFNFPGINQVNINVPAGLNFATTLRTFLRQDPEVILVGEIRDQETAEIAMKAAMTGHLVLSTLHTNDGPSTVARLVDIGIPGYMVASALTGVLSQRLAKTICPHCKVEDGVEYTVDQLGTMGLSNEHAEDFKAYKGKGCNRCAGTGNKGRTGVFEFMKITETIKEAISNNYSESALRRLMLREGTITLREDALLKVKQGIISIDEAINRTVKVADQLPTHLMDTYELIFEHGDYVAKEGSRETHFYQLIQGNLNVIKRGQVVGEISRPNEFFCELSPMFKQVHTASIQSNGRSVVRFFPSHKLKDVMSHSVEFSMAIMDKLVAKLSDKPPD